MFEDLGKQAEEAQKRWKEIEDLAEEVKQSIEPMEYTETTVYKTAQLILLLVEQFKPINSLDSKAFEKGMRSIFGSLTGG